MEGLTPIKWNKAAKKQLRPAGAVNSLEREVLAGRAQLWSANNGQLLVVTGIEVYQGRTEFVIIAAAGRGLRRSATAIHNQAKSSGASTIRFHTFHPKRLANTIQYWPGIYLFDTRGLFRKEYIFKLEVV